MKRAFVRGAVSEMRLNRHRALDLCLSMTISENRFALFRIML